jgi:DMSO/TMAO reductase YedYZ heme-binding membrane subunit
MMNRLALAISALVILLFAGYYWILRAMAIGLGSANAIVAFSAVIVIGISFLLGPLARFIGPVSRFAAHRKDFGLIGYFLAALHVLLVVPLLLSQEGEAVTLSDAVSVAVAAVAFMIFTLMFLTSTQKWMATLGFENWKSLQRTGYIAIVLVIAHVVLLENGVFLSRLTGQAAIAFVLLILFLRALVLVLRKRDPQQIVL